MSDLYDLYQQVILDHNKSPRNFGPLEGATHNADGHNPLCGDRVTVHLQVEDQVVRDVHFEGSGCAISTASASMMTQGIKGRPIQEIETLFHAFHELVTGKEASPDVDLGKLEVFSGVSDYPMRVKCATLVWHTMQAALHQSAEPVSTE